MAKITLVEGRKPKPPKPLSKARLEHLANEIRRAAKFNLDEETWYPDTRRSRSGKIRERMASVLAVECPKCLAPPLQACLRPGQSSQGNHQERHWMARGVYKEGWNPETGKRVP